MSLVFHELRDQSLPHLAELFVIHQTLCLQILRLHEQERQVCWRGQDTCFDTSDLKETNAIKEETYGIRGAVPD